MIESFASEDEIGGLRKRMDELLTQFDCSVSSIFSTKNQVLFSFSFSFFLKNKFKFHHMFSSDESFDDIYASPAEEHDR